MKSNYSVWVGGGEVNDSLLTLQEATQLAEWYVTQGYDDVVIEKVKEETNA